MEAAHASIRRARPLLGTFVEIAAAGKIVEATEAAVEAAFSAIATVHRLMSFHETDSDVSRLNWGAALGAVQVHDWTYQVLAAACDLHRRSSGAFDIAVATALQRLGLLPESPPLSSPADSAAIAGESRRSPNRGDAAEYWTSAFAGMTPDNLRARRQLSDMRAVPCGHVIQLLPENRVRFADHAVKIDLGGIAKGFAVDRGVDALRRHGVAEGLVNAGGDLRVFGPRSHVIDIRDPRWPGSRICRVALSNAALASSGSRFDPVRSRHPLDCSIIDSATAMPARSIRGATVCAPDCMIADALTKVVMNIGEAAVPILEHYEADALFMSEHGCVHITANWKNEVHLAA